jgi:putative intracellular protease/amidase
MAGLINLRLLTDFFNKIGQKHTDVVVVDGNLVTGQNGASSKRTAQAIIDQVGRTANQVAPLVSALAN